MPRQFIKRYLPDHKTIRDQKQLRFLGERLHEPNLWHLNRRSVAGALGVGIFIAFLPVLGQMIIAAVTALWLRINLPLTVVAVWITNPITMTPMFYFCYKIGIWILDRHPDPFHFNLSFHWLMESTQAILVPLLVGSLVVGTLAGTLSYIIVRLAWRYHIINKINKRRRSKHRNASQKTC